MLRIDECAATRQILNVSRIGFTRNVSRTPLSTLMPLLQWFQRDDYRVSQSYAEQFERRSSMRSRSMVPVSKPRPWRRSIFDPRAKAPTGVDIADGHLHPHAFSGTRGHIETAHRSGTATLPRGARSGSWESKKVEKPAPWLDWRRTMGLSDCSMST